MNTPQAGVIEAFLVADGDNVTSGAQIAKLNTNANAKPSSGFFFLINVKLIY